MTEEQKEHEAMKLVNLINDMHNLGVVTPAVPGPDGRSVLGQAMFSIQHFVVKNCTFRPQQVEHVLQLRDHAAAQSGATADNQEDSESD